jgi:hypothetical protein
MIGSNNIFPNLILIVFYSLACYNQPILYKIERVESYIKI